MALSLNDLSLILEEISLTLFNENVSRISIQRVLQSKDSDLVLQLRIPGATHYLLVNATPEYARVHFIDHRPKQPSKPTAFTMLLRKWIQGGQIDAITQLNQDRIIRVDITARDPHAMVQNEDSLSPIITVSLSLILELTSQHPNIYLVDQHNRILGKQGQYILGDRELAIDSPYSLPPKPPSIKPDFINSRHNLEQLNPHHQQRSHALQIAYQQFMGTDTFEERWHALQRKLKKHLKSLKRRQKNIEADLNTIQNAQVYRKWGELLQSAYGRAQRGMSSITVPNYYVDGMPEIEIPLDPAKSIQQNIDRYFHQYRRYHNATEQVETRLLNTMEQVDAFKQALQQCKTITTLAELERFEHDLIANQLLTNQTQSPSKRRQKSHSRQQPYREFISVNSLPIYVGRGAKHNDELSTHIARGRDIWLHARDWPGSHVLLRMAKDTPPSDEDLLDAATLAAHFSKGRNDSLVDVTYTRAKHIRKPKGFAPGMVTVAGGSTLAIRIDSQRLDRLLRSEKK